MPPALPRPTRGLTNIGASVPTHRPLTEVAPHFVPPGGTRPTGIPEALPVASFEGDPNAQRLVAPDPLWISRWQNSKTRPLSKAPWVKGYRWWAAGVAYQSWGPRTDYRIDLMWTDHRHAYFGISRPLWEEFRLLTTSVGEWFHKRILGPNWRRGKGALFPNFRL